LFAILAAAILIIGYYNLSFYDSVPKGTIPTTPATIVDLPYSISELDSEDPLVWEKFSILVQRDLLVKLNIPFPRGVLLDTHENRHNNVFIAATQPPKQPPKPKPTTSQKATIVIMAHSLKRRSNINLILWCYQQMTHALESIIFVWNNPQSDMVPEIIQLANATTTAQQQQQLVPIRLYDPKTNLMTNRFEAPQKLVSDKDAPILLVDDDVLLSEGLILELIRAWQDCHNGNCLTGLDARSVDPYRLVYSYQPAYGTNLAIGKTMMVKNSVLENYLSRPPVVERTSDPNLGCEDISLSLLVTNLTKTLPRILPSDDCDDYNEFADCTEKAKASSSTNYFSYNHKHKLASNQTSESVGIRYTLPEPEGLSSSKNQNATKSVSSSYLWTDKRNKCIQWNVDYYGDALVDFLQENQGDPPKALRRSYRKRPNNKTAKKDPQIIIDWKRSSSD